jgi:hypothetical protein
MPTAAAQHKKPLAMKFRTLILLSLTANCGPKSTPVGPAHCHEKYVGPMNRPISVPVNALVRAHVRIPRSANPARVGGSIWCIRAADSDGQRLDRGVEHPVARPHTRLAVGRPGQTDARREIPIPRRRNRTRHTGIARKKNTRWRTRKDAGSAMSSPWSLPPEPWCAWRQSCDTNAAQWNRSRWRRLR